MIIDRLQLEEFRSFSGHHKLVLEPAGARRTVVLLSGERPGRCDILEAIKLALYGKRARLQKRRSQAWDTYLRRAIHPAADPIEGARVQLDLRLVIDEMQRKVEVHRRWRATPRRVYEELSIHVDGQPDEALTDCWDDFIEEVLPVEICDLFFFDAELLEDGDEPGALADVREAFDQMMGLRMIEQLDADLVELEQRHLSECEATSSDVAKLRDELREAEEHCFRLGDDIQQARRRLEQRQRYARLLDDQLRQRAPLLRAQRHRRRQRLDAVEQRIEEIREALGDWMADGAALLGAAPLLEDLRRHLGAAGSDQSASVRDDQAEQDRQLLELLRSRPVDPGTLAEVEEMLAKRRQERPESGAPTQAARLAGPARELLDTLVDGGLDQRRRRLRHLRDELAAHQRQAKQLRAKLAQVPWEHSMAGVVERHHRAVERVEQTRSELRRLDVEHRRASQEASSLSGQLRHHLDDELGEAQAVRAGPTLTHGGRIRRGLAKFRRLVRRERLEYIERLLLDTARILLGDEQRAEEAKIDPDSLQVTLLDAAGDEIDTADAEPARCRLLALAIRWALARAFGQRMPVVLNGPAVPHPESCGPLLAERYFPRVSSQLILMVDPRSVEAVLDTPMRRLVSHHYQLLRAENSQGISVQRATI